MHRNAAIETALRRAGLTPRLQRRGAFWIIAVFERREWRDSVTR